MCLGLSRRINLRIALLRLRWTVEDHTDNVEDIVGAVYHAEVQRKTGDDDLSADGIVVASRIEELDLCNVLDRDDAGGELGDGQRLVVEENIVEGLEEGAACPGHGHG